MLYDYFELFWRVGDEMLFFFIRLWRNFLLSFQKLVKYPNTDLLFDFNFDSYLNYIFMVYLFILNRNFIKR